MAFVVVVVAVAVTIDADDEAVQELLVAKLLVVVAFDDLLKADSNTAGKKQLFFDGWPHSLLLLLLQIEQWSDYNCFR